jgi:predicted nucleic acid-binding protein
MPYLFDTNVFLRLASQNDPQRSTVLGALQNLRARNEVLCYTPQVLSEFWNVCTRPATSRGGLGLSLSQTERKARVIERYFRLLPDSLATFQEWRRLIVAHSVMGLQVHDAKLAASVLTFGVTHLLTFNTDDFQRYTGFTTVNPANM